MTYQEQEQYQSKDYAKPVLGVCGVPLEGTKVVRIAYMDESGVDPNDPLLIQAAIIVHGDAQLVPLCQKLDALIEKHIPEQHMEGFVFHAADIYNGNGIFKDRAQWPHERRHAILDDLVSIPAAVGLPLAVAIIDKPQFRNDRSHLNHRKEAMEVAIHAMAIIQCEIGVELWMRNNAPDEIVHIIAEDNKDVRQAAREAHVLLKDGPRLAREGVQNPLIFPFVKIWDGLQFASKEESKALQVADVCAWAMRRFFKSLDNGARFYGPLRPMIIRPSASDLASLEQQLQ